jgi:hypothetical protein
MPRLPLDARRMLQALQALDARAGADACLVIGEDAALILAYQHLTAAERVDAFAAKGGLRMADLDVLSRAVAEELNIEPSWLNAHFETFTGVLPADYATRLRSVFKGKHIQVDALSPEDLLIMKCFAGRDKDRPHARKLIKLASDLALVDRQLEYLVERRYPGAERAVDYFDDLRDEAGL